MFHGLGLELKVRVGVRDKRIGLRLSTDVKLH